MILQLTIKNVQCTFKKLASSIIVWILFPMFLTAQIDTVQHRVLPSIGIHYTPPTVQTSGNVTTISQEQIQKQQGNGSVNNLLEQMPSMVTTSDAGTGIGYTYMRIRGIDQTRINVTLNGVTVNDAESQGSWLVNLPDLGSYIEQVQVQSGANTTPGAISYGARIDFRTKEIPNNPFATISSAYGSFNSFHNTISAGTGLLGKRFSAMATFSNIRSDGYMDRATARLNAAFFSAQYKLLNFSKQKDYGTLKFNLLYGSEHTGLAWNGVSFDSLTTNRTYNSCGEYYTNDGQRRYYDNETDNYTQTHYQLEYAKNWNQPSLRHHHKINVLAHLTRGLGYYEEYNDDFTPTQYGLVPSTPDIEFADFVTRKYLDNYYYGIHANYEGNYRFKSETFQEIGWITGIDADIYDGDLYGKVIWAQPASVQDFPIDYRWYNGTGDKLQTKVFAETRYLYKHFSIRAELQYRRMDYCIGGTDEKLRDVTQAYIWNFLNPKIAIHYYLDNKRLKHSFDLSFSTANREPTRTDIIDGPITHKPIPETVFDVEFNYMVSHDKFYVNATLYEMYYFDQLVLTGQLNDVGAAIMTNVGKSYRIGAELAIAYQPVKFFTWHFNGNVSRNRIVDFVNYVDNWDSGEQIAEHIGNTPISFSPNVVLANDFTFTPLKNFDISFTTKFVGKQYLDNSGNDDYCLKPYSYSNLRISYTFEFGKLAKSLELYFQVNNIFNAQYESNGWLYNYYYSGNRYADAGYYPQAGVNFLGGLRLRF